MKKAGIDKSLLLAVGSGVGLYASVIFAATGQMKADSILYHSEEPVPESRKAQLALTWKCYVPAVLSTLATTGCIIGSQYFSKKEIAALTGSIALLAANRDKIEQAIAEKYGKESLTELKNEAALKEVEIVHRAAEETGKGDLLCYEGYSGRWFRSNKRAVEEAEKEFSNRFKEGQYLCLNDFYELLGIEVSTFGNQFGYAASEDYYDFEDGIEFVNTILPADKTDCGEALMIIDLFTYPMECWMEV